MLPFEHQVWGKYTQQQRKRPLQNPQEAVGNAVMTWRGIVHLRETFIPRGSEEEAEEEGGVNIAKCVRLHLMGGYFGVSVRCILRADEERRRTRRKRGRAVIDEEAETSRRGGAEKSSFSSYLLPSSAHSHSRPTLSPYALVCV